MHTPTYRRQEFDGPSHIGPFYDMMLDRVTGPAHFVEVGVYFGRSAAHMARRIYETGKNVRFDCVDHFEGSPELVGFDDGSLLVYFAMNMLEAGLLNKINVVKMKSTEAAAGYPDECLDFVFIDANHSYEHVAADIAAWLPKVKPGGVLAGHDWSHEPVRRAVTDAFEKVQVADGRPDSWYIEKNG